MIKEFIIHVSSALVATFGFTLVYNIRGKNAVIAAFCGAVSWTTYLICHAQTESLFVPYLISGAVIALYSEIAAYIFKTPATVYLILGIIPLVPGLTIFRAMEACIFGELSHFLELLIETLKIGGSIALGLIFMSSLLRLFRSGVNSMKTKNGI